MVKKIKIENLDCANCAAKIEDGIKSVEGVNSVSVNFLTEKIVLDMEDSKEKEVLSEVKKICRKVEPDCELII